MMKRCICGAAFLPLQSERIWQFEVISPNERKGLSKMASILI